MIEAGGDLNKAIGTIYGERMDKESTGKFDKRGIVAMSPLDEHHVGSRFFITLGDFSHLNYKAVVVGEVVEGLNDLYELSRTGDVDGLVRQTVTITDCGQSETMHLQEPQSHHH